MRAVVINASTLTPPTEDSLDLVRERKANLRSLNDPAWRFSMAKRILDERTTRFSRQVDPLVLRLVEFLRAHREAESAQDLDTVEDTYPDIYWAHNVYSSEGRGPRYHIEALILANEEPEQICEYLDLPDAVLDAYEAYFFDVRRTLENPTAVRTYLFGRGRERGARDGDHDLLWKQLALSADLSTLRVLWEARVLSDDEAKKLDDLVASNIRRDTLEAQHIRVINQYNATEIIDQYMALRNAETERSKVELVRGTAGSGGVGQFVAALLQSIQFTMAPFGSTRSKLSIEMGSAISELPALMNRLHSGGGKTSDQVFAGDGGEGAEESGTA